MTVGMSTFYYIDYWGRKEIIEMWQLLDDAWPLIERGRSRVNKLMTSFRPSFFFLFFFSLVLHGCTYYSNASPICVISQDKCNDVTRWSKFVQNFDKKFHTLFRTAEKIFSVTKKNSANWRNFITTILIWIKVLSIPFLILWYEKKTTTTFSFQFE